MSNGRKFTAPPELVLDAPIDMLGPEKRLLVAVIQRAMVDYAVPIKGQHHIQKNAGKWLFSKSKHPMSLYWICEMLSESPEWLQKSIQQMVQSGKMKSHIVIIRVDTK
jgi:hypothetical protein